MLIIENQLLNGLVVFLPTELVKHLSQVLLSYDQYKTSDGYKRIKHILYPEYNNINNQKEIGRPCVKYNELKRIKNFFDTYTGKQNDIEFILNGGLPMKNWVDTTLATMRSSVHDELNKIKTDTRVKNNGVHVSKSPSRVVGVNGKQINTESLRALNNIMSEGTAGYKPMDSDGAFDLKYELVTELLRALCNRISGEDPSNVYYAIGNLILFVENLKEELFTNSSLADSAVGLARDRIAWLLRQEDWIDGWKEPDRIREELHNVQDKLSLITKQYCEKQ